MGEVKLYGVWASPFSRRVLWTLKLKGIPFEYIEEDLHNKSAELLKYNPVYKKVPVLVHGGKPICESMIIVEYIDEIWPHNSLLPADPYDKAQARFWVKYIEEKSSAFGGLFRSNGEKLNRAIEDSLELLKVIEDRCLSDNKKLHGGDNIDIVDIAFGALIHWLQIMEEVIEVKILEDDKFPRLCSWITNFREVTAISENLPDREKLLPTFKYLRQRALASAA